MGKKIIITGATGLIGKNIISLLTKKGYSIVVFTRNIESAKKRIINSDSKIEFVSWDYTKPINDIIKYLDGSYSIINLAGASIGGKRWNGEYKNILFDSRILTARKLIEAITKCINKPESFINSSAIGYYGTDGDEICNEESKYGNDFLAKLCVKWEEEALKAENMRIRTTVIRTGIVLDKNEGALKKLLISFKLYTGGYQGNGKQWVSWIHIDDLVNLYLLSLENKNIRGALNGTAPEPITNKVFCKAIGNALRRPSYLPVPGFMLKIVLGEFADYLLTGKRVLPEKAIRNGYIFKFTNIDNALNSLIK